MTTPEESRGFQPFAHGHRDLVLAADFNFYGTRLATASSDHHLKVWDRKPDHVDGGGWKLVDEWRAHDAEVTDVKWAPPFSGTYLGSIAEDGLFKLWGEDLSAAPLSGQRFHTNPNATIPSKPPSLAWNSLDFKHSLDSQTYLALISRDGSLSIFEPRDADELQGDWTDWMGDAPFYVFTSSPGGSGVGARQGTSSVARPMPADRSQETSFRVAWHKEKLPCPAHIAAGLNRGSLSLVVAAMNVIKVIRTDSERRLYIAAVLEGHKGLVRDVSWANGAMRGFDILASCGKDGSVRVWELHAPSSNNGSSTRGNVNNNNTTSSASLVLSSGTNTLVAGGSPFTATSDTNHSHSLNGLGIAKPHSNSQSKPSRRPSVEQNLGTPNSQQQTSQQSLIAHRERHHSNSGAPHSQSAIGASLASAGGTHQNLAADTTGSAGQIRDTVKLAAELTGHKGPVWRVGFNSMGDVLTSAGDDGTVRTWKRGVGGKWFEYSEIQARGA